MTRTHTPRATRLAVAPSPAPQPGPRFVCANHIDQSVTWKGRGCPDCIDEDRERAARLAAIRRKRLAAQAGKRGGEWWDAA